LGGVFLSDECCVSAVLHSLGRPEVADLALIEFSESQIDLEIA
jgi:hypothetical protein